MPKHQRPRAKTVSHSRNPATVTRGATLFPEFDRVQPTANVFLQSAPIELAANDKLKKKLNNAYMDVLDAVEAIADNPDVSENEVIDFTNKTIDFLKLVQNLPEDVVTRVQDREQLKAIKNYAKDCADIFVSKGFNQVANLRTRVEQHAPDVQTLNAANEGLENTRQRLTDKSTKHLTKARKYENKSIFAIASFILAVTIPIAIPLMFYFTFKREKQVRKWREANTELQQLNSLRDTFSNVQTQLQHIGSPDAKLNLSAEEKAEQMRTLKASVQEVKQALRADLQHSSIHRRTRRP